MNLETLKKALKKSWKKDTCYTPMQKDYDSSNPAYGQCFATVLVVNDYFGGKILKKKWGVDEGHFWNLIEGEEVDLTRGQFTEKEDFSNPIILERVDVEIEKYAEQIERYKILKKRVEDILKE
jgi:hypothetical protein